MLPKRCGKLRLILQGFEVALGERVVVGGVGPVVRAGDAKVGQQQAVSMPFEISPEVPVENSPLRYERGRN